MLFCDLVLTSQHSKRLGLALPGSPGWNLAAECRRVLRSGEREPGDAGYSPTGALAFAQLWHGLQKEAGRSRWEVLQDGLIDHMYLSI